VLPVTLPVGLVVGEGEEEGLSVAEVEAVLAAEGEGLEVKDWHRGPTAGPLMLPTFTENPVVSLL
jgi:hypothetical protein